MADLISKVNNNLYGSNIKSIQRGTITWTNQTTKSVTISEVDLTKAIVLITCNNRAGYLYASTVSAYLDSSTSIKFESFMINSGFDNYITWQVIEFNNVKSLQKGELNLTTSSATSNVNISTIDVNKSIIFHNIKSNANNTDQINVATVTSEIVNSTSIKFTSLNGAASIQNIKWQVIEFN